MWSVWGLLMTSQNGRAFNEWLRAQLKAKKMSQRQLAQQSGVDHSTISRLIRGDRMPSLGTATKLARGLREIRDDADTPGYLGMVTSGAQNPTARVEYALRADEGLTEPQVRQVMEYYLAVRVRRFGRVFQAADRWGSSDARANETGRAGGSAGGSAQGSAGGSPLAAVGGGASRSAPESASAMRHTPVAAQVRASVGTGASPRLMPRVGVATRVAPTPMLTRVGGGTSNRY
jgi:transcriptional regulator with XRE-family HTH domain